MQKIIYINSLEQTKENRRNRLKSVQQKKRRGEKRCGERMIIQLKNENSTNHKQRMNFVPKKIQKKKIF